MFMIVTVGVFSFTLAFHRSYNVSEILFLYVVSYLMPTFNFSSMCHVKRTQTKGRSK
jgi:hypothetical protein